MDRIVERELLDHLPAQDPDALRSRRDLQRLNSWMGNPRIVSGLLRQALAARRIGSPICLVELGAGDGTFICKVLPTLSIRDGGKVYLVDRQKAVASELPDQIRALGWEAEFVQADVFAFLQSFPSRAIAMVANLFLHHFHSEELKELLALVAARTEIFIATEPTRSQWSLLTCRFLGLLGCNRVTRHDALASIRAGFKANEIATHWPEGTGWKISETKAGFATHAFSAIRGPGL